jgi:hypothetical protein
MKGKLLRSLMFGAFAAAATFVCTPAASAGDCCEYTVEGCGTKVKVCVPEKCGSSAEGKAKKAFEGAYKCKSVKVPSHIGTCSNSKCEIDFR